MNTMEVTKFVGAICGSLLIFLLIQTAAHAIYNTESETVAFEVEGAETGGAGGEDAAEDVDIEGLMAAADADKGATVFKKCAACHKLDGNDGVGPHLNGVVGRPVASIAGFSYSDGMQGHGGDWTPEEIFHFLANPKKDVPGTKMSFAGLPKPEDRANVIAYLESQGG
jgi:cytochrome c